MVLFFDNVYPSFASDTTRLRVLRVILAFESRHLDSFIEIVGVYVRTYIELGRGGPALPRAPAAARARAGGARYCRGRHGLRPRIHCGQPADLPRKIFTFLLSCTVKSYMYKTKCTYDEFSTLFRSMSLPGGVPNGDILPNRLGKRQRNNDEGGLTCRCA